MAAPGHAKARSAPSPYVRVGHIARGGMGYVELGLRREAAFERLYAIKRLHTHFRDDEDFRAMFMEEARVAGLLRHPNVVSVLDVGADDDGPFLVMDLVDGVALMAVVDAFRARGELLPLQVGLAIARQAAEGLHAAHELRGHDGTPLALVHRDVSPQNILVDFEGVARITDFGVAKAVGRNVESTAAVLKGKVGYMSPEQLRFEPIDRRSDLFALGIVLYEALAGQRLYAGREVDEVARRILHESPPDLGAVRDDAPPALIELLFDLLCKDRELRPATGAEVARRLAEIQREVDSQTGAEQGPFELRDFMQQHFAAEREERAAQRATALRTLGSAPAPALAPVSPDAITVTAAATAVPPVRARRQRRTLALAAFGATVLVAGGVALALWLGSDATEPAAPAPPRAAAPTAPAPIPATPPSPTAVATEPPPSPAATASAPPDEEPAPRKRERRRERPPTKREGGAYWSWP